LPGRIFHLLGTVCDLVFVGAEPDHPAGPGGFLKPAAQAVVEQSHAERGARAWLTGG
jgi:hypothetical protein